MSDQPDDDSKENFEKTTQQRGYPADVKLAPDTSYVGTTLNNRYLVEKLVGRGGMGALYAGTHTEIGRKVAIKLMHKDVCLSEDVFLRFKQEAKLAGALSHHNICSVYDFGRLPDCTPYLIMDLLQGKTLSDIVRREKRMPHEQAVKIFIQICDALTYAHANGIVHRDLKPSNIMVEDGTKMIKVLDFGIAKSLEADGPQLTAANELLGSPYYMSPEQCQSGNVDQRTDIYSMGCLMYECLTGRPPFKASSALQTMYSHVHVEPDKMSAVAPDANIPTDLEAVVFKALSKAPDQRQQTAEELKQDLLNSTGPASGAQSGATAASVQTPAKLPGKPPPMIPIIIASVLLIVAVAGFLNRDNISIILDGRVPGETYNGDDSHIYKYKLNENSNVEAIYLSQAHDTPRSKDNDLSIRGHATVRLTGKDPKVILVLASHAQIEWNVVVPNGTVVEKVLTSSEYGENVVKGVPDSAVVKIKPAPLNLSEGEDLFKNSYFQTFDQDVKAATGSSIHNLQYVGQFKEFEI